MKKERFRCDICGVFISVADLSEGYATRRLIMPDSYLTSEEYETTCKLCSHGFEKVDSGEMKGRS
jgi:hypothetical protein